MGTEGGRERERDVPRELDDEGGGKGEFHFERGGILYCSSELDLNGQY